MNGITGSAKNFNKLVIYKMNGITGRAKNLINQLCIISITRVNPIVFCKA